MPTTAYLTGVECRLDQDQDPEVMSCIWHYNLGPGTEPAALTTSTALDANLVEEFEQEAETAELEFV